mmetsp:Transcript_100796/g.240269  ORF Transcript_100796/g.240269 Transcript_100796/m.240269 type:complete len:151 (-) Transcript_100796:19-471(-)
MAGTMPDMKHLCKSSSTELMATRPELIIDFPGRREGRRDARLRRTKLFLREHLACLQRETAWHQDLLSLVLSKKGRVALMNLWTCRGSLVTHCGSCMTGWPKEQLLMPMRTVAVTLKSWPVRMRPKSCNIVLLRLPTDAHGCHVGNRPAV